MMEKNMETTVVCWGSTGIYGGMWWSLYCGGQGSVFMGNASLGRIMLFSVA